LEEGVMTTYETLPIDFDAVSAPIEGETLATVQLVADDPWADDDWVAFWDACHECAGRYDGVVDPNVIRGYLSNQYGLTIEPRRYSAFWSRAAGKNGFLVADGWVTNDDTKGGNRGKPLRRYRLRSVA
jgi:hypothetical protein